MADPRVELRDVKEELALIEQQLEELLERQQALMTKKEQLEEAIRDQSVASTSSTQVSDWNKSDFKWSQKLNELKKNVFNIDTFRPLQLQTMNATLSGKDCVLIMPTGGGKSLCFQLPALISEGVTLVVSPLVSLMEDQLLSLQQFKVEASLLNASSTKADVNRVHAAMTDKKSTMRLLYCTPEKLAKSKRFMNKLEKMYDAGRFSRLVIDEVHCCSQWGHDFRPDYKFLGVMKRQFPGVPILGLTATATNNVVQDVKKILNIPSCLQFRASFNRDNLYYEVRAKPTNQQATYDDMAKIIKTRFNNQSGIVYCFSRRDSEDVTVELQKRGISCGCYHADIHANNKSSVHRQWLSNKIQVVVATIAFGMGIDKPDVRFVIHHSISKSMENYYQESGRAGRDGARATCLLYASFGDTFRQSTMVFTEQTGLAKLYSMVTYAFELSKCRRVLIARHFGEQFDSAQCKGMCDHCDTANSGNTLKKDVTKYSQDILALLHHARSTQQRVTGLKVVDAWMGKGVTSLRVSSVKAPALQRSDCERVLLYLVTHDYIQEDFHFTAYSTISYIVPGPRAPLLTAGGKKIEMELPGPVKRPTATLTKSATAPATTTITKSENRAKIMRKLTVANPERSSILGYTNSAASQKTASSKGEEKSTDKNAKDVKVAAKKRPVIESDDDCDLDFCEDIPVKKTKMFGSSNYRKSDNDRGDFILLDSDDENSGEAGIEGNNDVERNSVKSKGKSNKGKNSELSKSKEKVGNSSTNNISNGIVDSDDDDE